MKSLQDEISRMKIKNVLNGFKEWREGTVERTFLNETPSSTFKPVGGGGGNSHTKRTVGVGVLSYLLGIKKRELGGPLGVYADCAFTFNIIS